MSSISLALHTPSSYPKTMTIRERLHCKIDTLPEAEPAQLVAQVNLLDQAKLSF